MFVSAALTVALAAQLGMAAPPPRSPASARRAFMVAGYLPSWRFGVVPAERLKGLTDLVVFSIQPTDQGEVDFGDLDMSAVRRYRASKGQIGYRMWITVGGWGRSRGFAPTARLNENRRRLLQELSYFMEKEGFEGVTFDWQHPRAGQETLDYSLLLSEAKRVLTPRKKLVAATLAPWVELPSPALKELDRIFLMSYDYQGQHSTLADAERDLDRVTRRGAPASRVVLGIPFYGRSLTDWSQTKGYGELFRLYNPADFQDEAGGFWFNGPETIRRKVAMARQRGLAGVAAWELGQDAAGEASLLRAAALAADSAVLPQPRPDPDGGSGQGGRSPRTASKSEKINFRRLSSATRTARARPAARPARKAPAGSKSSGRTP